MRIALIFGGDGWKQFFYKIYGKNIKLQKFVKIISV